jgi:formylglycine-generating enzyme required for sulfatase activity/type II secretory pathway predicted ATPase ExeA
LAESRDVFVIWDFTIPGLDLILECLVEEHEHVRAASLGNAPSQGQVFQTAIKDRLAEVGSAIAYVDRANANVGFEIGYALGLGLPVALACKGPNRPEWVQEPPLAGHQVPTEVEVEAFENLLASGHAIDPPGAPDPGDDVLFVCPKRGSGSALHRRVGKVHPTWRRLPAQGWSLPELPEKLRGVGTVVWVLTESEEERDGLENATGAIVAGYALGAGHDLRVLRSRHFRRAVDVVHRERRFEALEEFERILREIEEPLPVEVAADPLPAYLAHLRSLHGSHAAFFPGASGKVLEEVYVDLQLEVSSADADRRAEPGWSKVTCELGARLGGRPVTLEDLLDLPPDGDVLTGRWVLLGDPGAGKSTLSRHLVLQLAQREDGPVPVFLSLTRFAQERERHPFRLAEEETRGARCDLAAAGLERRLLELAREPGRVWLFLDGLDEVAAGRMDALRERLQALVESLPEARFCVTSRPIGYRDLGPAFRAAKLRSLDATGRRKLIVRWLDDEEEADRILARIGTRPQLEPLTGNPLMLTLVVGVAVESPDLPATRTALYDEAIRQLLRRGWGGEGKGVRNPGSAREILAELALELQEKDGAAWDVEELDDVLLDVRKRRPRLGERLKDVWKHNLDFLEDVARGSAVLGCSRGEHEPWEFLHRQFRDFLAGEALQRRGRDAVLAKIEALEKDDVPRWAEALAYACHAAGDALALLAEIREKDAALARRILPEVEGVAPRGVARLPARDGGLGRRGPPAPRAARGASAATRSATPRSAALLARVVPGCPTFELACVHWVLETIGRPPERRAFFEACGRWPDGGPPELDLVEIPGGTFEMGSPEDEEGRFDDEGPLQPVTVDSFLLARTPVTNGQYEAFDPDHERERWEGVSEEELFRHPVVRVSWWEARLFCRWVGCALPSESRWEYACRAGSRERWCFGDAEEELPDHAWYFVNSGASRLSLDTEWDVRKVIGEWACRSHEVACLRANRFGLHDMHGNVFEWCEDTWHDAYEGAPADGTALVQEGAEVPGRPRRVVELLGAQGRALRVPRLDPRRRPVELFLGFRPARLVTT